MKKLLYLITTLCLLIPCIQANGAELDKKTQKALKKEMKDKLKQYKKEGWQIFGSTRTLESALEKHYTKLEELGDDGHETAGIATKCKSKNNGYQLAINNACITYAQSAGSDLQGRVMSDIFADGAEASGEFEHFYAAYERQVQKEIRGEMEESFSILRDNGDGTYEIQSFFIVSESAASKARMRALENAMKESEAAQLYADKISDFVRNGK
ncbi:MAG: hypothetical protein LIP02_00275 [Bacteroidales bacterium]|nr:hypothetical protein [Bacteroidales bacterium]